NLDPAVLQIDGVGQQGAGLLGLILKGPVVITRDDNLVPVGQGTQPDIELLDIFQRALTEAVTGVDQHVSVRDMRDFPMQAVGIRNADQFHTTAPAGGGSAACCDQYMEV